MIIKESFLSLEAEISKCIVYGKFWARLSKIRTSLVNVSLKFRMLVFQIGQNCLLKKCEKLLVFFGDFRCGALLFMVIHVIYK